MEKAQVLAWIHGFEAARDAERALARREPVDPGRSLALGLSLIEWARRSGGGVLGRDRRRDEEVRSVRERWAKLWRAIES